jgi:hypothetical protein
MYLFKNEEQEGKTGPVWGWYQWVGEDIRKGCRSVSIVVMYEMDKWINETY